MGKEQTPKKGNDGSPVEIKRLVRQTARRMFYVANKNCPKSYVQKWSDLGTPSQQGFIALAKWHLRNKAIA